jgi:probable HAF family extracellular repeat protein
MSAVCFLPGALAAVGALAALIVAGPTGKPPPPTYTVTDLGTLGGPESEARGINNRSQVVGVADTAHGAHHAFLWQRGRMRDLGTLGGKDSEARGINNKGQVVGVADTGRGRPHTPDAFLWNKGVMHDLGTLGGEESDAWGVNDAGEIVGAVYPENGFYAFLYSRGRVHRLRGLSGSGTEALAINNRGQIVGTSAVSYNEQHGFLYSRGKVIDLGWNVGSLRPNAINDIGWAAGYSHSYEEFSPVVWKNGILSFLDATNSFTGASAINNVGVIVGWEGTSPAAYDVRGCPCRALIWFDGKMKPLDSLIPSASGWQLERASAINDRGQIVGTGTHNGNYHAFLLTPK